MSGSGIPTDGGLLGRVRDAVRDRLERPRGSKAGTVIEVRGAGPDDRAALAAKLQDEHERPVFRLSPEDLVAAPHDRAAAVLRLLDAAEVAGAIPMLDAADHLVTDRAAAIGLEERLRSFPGLVVIATDGVSPLQAVVTQTILRG